MRLYLVLIAASSVIAQNSRVMNANPVPQARSQRATTAGLTPKETHPAMPPALPDYKAEIFMCGMGAEMNGYCCENLSKDGTGMGCSNAIPMIANSMEETVTFNCPMTIKDVKQKNTVGACCSPDATMVTPTMAIYKCQDSTFFSVNIESKKPKVVGTLKEEIIRG